MSLQALAHDLNALRSHPGSFDCTLIVKSDPKASFATIIRAHKFVLSFRSPVFATMLNCNMLESTTGEITIMDFTLDVMMSVVDFMYSADVKFTSIDQCLAVCSAADKYSIPSLVRNCESFLIQLLTAQKIRGLNKDAIIVYLTASEQFQMLDLEYECLMYLREHAERISRAGPFRTC